MKKLFCILFVLGLIGNKIKAQYFSLDWSEVNEMFVTDTSVYSFTNQIEWGLCGLRSANFLPNGTSGSFNFKVGQISTQLMVGFSAEAFNFSPENLKYGYYFNGRNLYVIVNGEGVVGVEDYESGPNGSTFSLNIEESTIKFFIDDDEIYSTEIDGSDYFVDVISIGGYNEITNLLSTFKNYETIELYSAFGNFLSNGFSIHKANDQVEGWNCAVYSKNILPYDEPGVLKFKISEDEGTKAIGFCESNIDSNIRSNFAYGYFFEGYNANIVINNEIVSNFGVEPGNELSIIKTVNNSIIFKLNNLELDEFSLPEPFSQDFIIGSFIYSNESNFDDLYTNFKTYPLNINIIEEEVPELTTISIEGSGQDEMLYFNEPYSFLGQVNPLVNYQSINIFINDILNSTKVKINFLTNHKSIPTEFNLSLLDDNGNELIIIDEFSNHIEYDGENNLNIFNILSLLEMGYRNLNWSQNRAFLNNNELVKETRTHIDYLGRAVQTKNKDFEYENYLTTEAYFDEFGRPTITTLPSFSGNSIGYSTNFTQTNSGTFDWINFSASKKLNPDKIARNTPNKTGYFYGNNSPVANVDETEYPFFQTVFDESLGGGAITSFSPGEAHKSGSNKGTSVINTFTQTELTQVYGTTNGLFNTFYAQADFSSGINYIPVTSNNPINAIKTITRNVDGSETISYTSSGGLSLARCVSGVSTNCTKTSQSFVLNLYSQNYYDVHIPVSAMGDLVIPRPYYSGTGGSGYISSQDVEYLLFDVIGQRFLIEGSSNDYEINSTSGQVTFYGMGNESLWLRIMVKVSDYSFNFYKNYGYSLTQTFNYKIDYSTWTINYYNLVGRNLQTVSPKGFDCTNPGNFSMSSYIVYNQRGEVIANKTPDAGTTCLIYDEFGRLRFSQNQQQRADDEFAYVLYDKFGRQSETGIYKPESSSDFFFDSPIASAPTSGGISVLNIVNSHQPFTSKVDDVTKIFYGKEHNGVQINNSWSHHNEYLPTNLYERLALVENKYSRIYYSYNEIGQPDFMVTEYLDDGSQGLTIEERYKTVNLTFDENSGAVSKIEFQKNFNGQNFDYRYFYDANLRLNEVNMYIDGTQKGKVKYLFDQLGRLSRKEQGTNLQGIDYVYNILGWLKSINNPDVNNSSVDPGKDNHTGSANQGFQKDLFGMSLDYFENDYNNSNNTIQASTGTGNPSKGFIGKITRQLFGYNNQITQYNNINGSIPSAFTTGSMFFYHYYYNDKSMLGKAQFGIYNNATNPKEVLLNDYRVGTGNIFTGGSNFNEITYDANGNLTELKRNAYNMGASYLMDDLTLNYTNQTNQCASVVDNSSTGGSISTGVANQTSNITRNQIGNTIQSQTDNVNEILYYPSGLVKSISFNNGNLQTYLYDAMGNRICSMFYDGQNTQIEYYYYLGSSLLSKMDLDNNTLTADYYSFSAQGIEGIYKAQQQIMVYEIKDHLGNVRLTYYNSGTTQSPSLEVLSWADYYPFGGKLPGRNYTASTYPTGYQGQPQANNTNWQNFDLRMYHPGLGSFLSIDPYNQFHSPFIGMGNDPVNGIDPDGGAMYFKNDMARADYQSEIIRQEFIMYGYSTSAAYWYADDAWWDINNQLDRLMSTMHGSEPSEHMDPYTDPKDEYNETSLDATWNRGLDNWIEDFVSSGMASDNFTTMWIRATGREAEFEEDGFVYGNGGFYHVPEQHYEGNSVLSYININTGSKEYVEGAGALNVKITNRSLFDFSDKRFIDHNREMVHARAQGGGVDLNTGNNYFSEALGFLGGLNTVIAVAGKVVAQGALAEPVKGMYQGTINKSIEKAAGQYFGKLASRIGTGTALVGFGVTELNHLAGNISDERYYFQQTINTIGLFGPWGAGIAIGVGVIDSIWGDDIEAWIRE